MDMSHYYHQEENRFRGAAHAGSWYTSNAPQLTADLLGWLSRVSPKYPGQQFPAIGCKGIIAPHAGYAFSGENAAWAYKCIDPSTTRRVFILGPSHHWRIKTCALSRCHTYDTPIGTLPVDTATVNSLYAAGGFEWMSMTIDEREHSIEMQLPYLRKVCEGKDIKIVPILIGNLDQAAELEYGEKIAPYLAQEGTIVIVSSDFCHWGQRYNYTFYYPKSKPIASPFSPDEGWHITRASPPDPDQSIWESITQLDHEGMGILADKNRSALTAHTDFHKYLNTTSNTICGCHAIGVLWGALARLESASGRKASCTWVKYDQSAQVTEVSEFSVSYASGWITI